MNPIFIYQNEAVLKGNNKFSIDFVDDQIVNFVSFTTNNQYYISSLNCNITKASKRKVTFSGTEALVADLSKTSRELLDKGTNSKNDITFVTSTLTEIMIFLKLHLKNTISYLTQKLLMTIVININFMILLINELNLQKSIPHFHISKVVLFSKAKMMLSKTIK